MKIIKNLLLSLALILCVNNLKTMEKYDLQASECDVSLLQKLATYSDEATMRAFLEQKTVDDVLTSIEFDFQILFPKAYFQRRFKDCGCLIISTDGQKGSVWLHVRGASRTALHFAARYNNIYSLKALIDYGKKHGILQQMLNVRDADGETPLDIAIRENCSACVDCLKSVSVL